MTTNDDVALISRFLDLHEPGTIGQMFNLLHPECVFELPFTGVSLAGTSAILENARPSHFVHWGRGTFVRRQLHGPSPDGTYVVEAKGDMVLPNGTAYDNHYVFVFQCRDGLLSLVREYFDLVFANAKLSEDALIGATIR